MVFFLNDAKLCSKRSLEQPNRTSIYKLTSSNFKCRRRRGKRRRRGEEEEEMKEEKEA